jgi:plasmid stabilization system protein ParE
MKLQVSNAALRDIAALLDYLTKNAGARVARRYAVDIDKAVDMIAAYPGIGAPRPEFGPMTRVSVVAPYRIFYDGDPDNDDVLVLRVLDGRRDITVEIVGRGRNA